MKIAVLTAIINRKSGARAPLEIAKALKRQGNEVAVFGYGFNLEREALKELKIAGVKLRIIRENKILAPLVLYRELTWGKFDLISFHGTLSFFLSAWFSGIPIVRTYYGTQLDPLLDKVFPTRPGSFLRLANRLVNALVILKEKFVLANSNKVLAISQYTQDELKRLYAITSEVVYLGAAPTSFKKRAKRNKKEISILSVSRIVPYKGFHKLIKVFNELNQKFPNIKLTIIGSSPNPKYLAYLKRMAKKNVAFLTNIPDEKLIEAYQQADIYATFDRYMFFGMPLLEAATFATPSVAIARCAALETINHGKTGFLAKDEAEFRGFLERLIKNRKLRNKLGKEAHRNSQRFSWKLLAKKYHQVFEKTKKEKSLKINWSLVGIILLGAILRFAFIKRHAFWFDEAFSYFVANRPVYSLLRATAADNHPPLYYLLLKLWLAISQEVWFLRLLSIIFGVLSIYLVYKVCQKLTSPKAAILATVIFALSPLHIYYSVETRMYSLLVLETLTLTWLFLKFTENQKKLTLFLLSSVGILALHTHYYSAFVLLSLNLVFLARIKKYRLLLGPWIIFQLAIIIPFVPWFVFALQNSKTDCWCFHPTIGLPAMFTSFAIGGMGVVTLKDFVFYGPKLPLFFFSLLSLLAFFAFLKGIWSLRRKMNQNLSLFVFFFVPILTPALIALFFPLFSPRSLMIISPFYYLFIALGIFSLKNKLAKKLLAKSLVILLLVTLIFQFFDPFFYGLPLKTAASFIAQRYQEQEAILHLSPMTFYSFQYFHQFSYPEFLTFPSDTTRASIFEIGSYQKPVKEIVSKYENIWLVNFLSWVKPEKVKEVKKTITKDFTLNLKKNYNNIEIYHYSRQ